MQESQYYYNRTRDTWDWHEAEAQKRGMHLASVVSEDENRCIMSLIGDTAWLGARRKSTSRQEADDYSDRYRGEDDWEWSDGSPWKFTRWDVREPNNHSGNEATC